MAVAVHYSVLWQCHLKTREVKLRVETRQHERSAGAGCAEDGGAEGAIVISPTPSPFTAPSTNSWSTSILCSMRLINAASHRWMIGWHFHWSSTKTFHICTPGEPNPKRAAGWRRRAERWWASSWWAEGTAPRPWRPGSTPPPTESSSSGRTENSVMWTVIWMWYLPWILSP